MPVRLLVVDDSSFFRKRICEILAPVAEIEVVGAAMNGREAIEKTRSLKPDVISMDYEMPVMDGVTAVRLIMEEIPTPILMFSTLTYEGARVTLDALEAGAVDFLPKNFEDISSSSSALRKVLTQRILDVAKSRKQALTESVTSAPSAAPSQQAPSSSPRPNAPAPARQQAPVRVRPGSAPQRETAQRTARPTVKNTGAEGRLKSLVDLVVIGTSTGGPVALAKILSRLPKDFPKPIVIIQHMPATFTPAFAERLNSISELGVRHAEDGLGLRAGEVVLAPGGKQLLLDKQGRQLSVRIKDGDDRLTYKPSVDITFGSAARALPGRALGIVLTGMGSDGREGARMLKACSSHIWTQDKNSSVIYGMPMAVHSAGYSDKQLNLDDIVPTMIEELM